MIYLDTHVVVWLYDCETFRFPESVKIALEKNELFICPIILLELQYLQEIGRINTDALLIVKTLKSSINLQVSKTSFEDIIVASLSQKWTRDPFDRMIVGAASLSNDILVSKDSEIKKNYLNTLWK